MPRAASSSSGPTLRRNQVSSNTCVEMLYVGVLTSASGVSDLSQEEAGTPKPALVEMQLLISMYNGRNATPLARIVVSVSSTGKELYQFQLPMVTRKSTSSVYAGKRDTYRTVHLSSHPEEPQCSYDPIEGLTLAESINPADKIRQLEEQICMSSLLFRQA